MEIKIKKLSEKAVIPSKAHSSDVGLDLTATSKKVVDEGDYGFIEYGTSLAIEIPEGYGGFIFPRSSISKTGHILANAVGLIDPGYNGEIMLRFKTVPGTKEYGVGDRIGQLVIMPYTQVEWLITDELDDTDRGQGGFGSSDTK